MPVANKTLDQDPFFTRLLLSIIHGSNPDYWSELSHKVTGWEYWKQPDGESLALPKNKVTVDRNSKTSPYPKSVLKSPTGVDYIVDTTKDAIRYSSKIWMGTYRGEPVQIANVVSGKVVTRSVSYGYHWNQDLYAEVPVVAGRLEHCGGPNVSSDRHVCIYDPVNGVVHELCQYDEFATDTPVTNQALSWAKFRNGKMIEGTAVTATSESITYHMWDRNSRASGGHRLGFIVGDYVGADGTLTSGPKAGGLLVLPKESESYRKMTALGGECAAVVDALSVFGARIVDRSGYSDSAQTRMKAPDIWTQWGSWTRTTNLDLLNILVHDLLVVE